MRISVDMILELLVEGGSVQEILEDYTQLEPDNIKEALLYAKRLVGSEEIITNKA